MTYPVTRHRWEGFLDAWRQAGGAPPGLRIAVCPVNATACGEALADELFRGGDPPDAIAAMSDELALGALRAAARAGRTVPGTVAITGWDDSDAAAPAGLTTLRQSLRDQGRRCARIALGHAPASRSPGPAELAGGRAHQRPAGAVRRVSRPPPPVPPPLPGPGGWTGVGRRSTGFNRSWGVDGHDYPSDARISPGRPNRSQGRHKRVERPASCHNGLPQG